MSGLVCALDVRVRHVDGDGVPTGAYIGLVNPVVLAIETPEPERQQRISKLRDSFGQALDEIVTPQPTTLNFSTDETGDAEVLAWSVNGQVGDYTQAAATVVEQEITVVKGDWYRLPHRMVSELVVEPVGGGTAFEPDIDYQLDPASGMVKFTQGGAIASGPVDVSYTAAAVTGKKVGAGSRASIQVRIEGEGINKANGKRVSVLVRRASLSASGAMDLVGDDFLVAELTGTALRVGQNDPVEIVLFD
ncbi:hypothetical protein WCE39_07950 [Luteimonas sp. MJ174]|uniref:phage tail tube protein n=1 Tax=Luteimonas sp. MJ174 TaxID=3129237 RepID=UPI0031B9B06E